VIWCDYCNANISTSGVLSCLRATCQTKAKVLTSQIYDCVIMYYTPKGNVVQISDRVIAPTSQKALEIAERHLRRDKRRVISSIEYTKATPL